jgi:UDP-N-acetylmuramoyl-L-alanyl-D-glutamate--2,6-diaminopimelate ligase
MEVSSRIHQKRTEALHFVGGVLTHDHLDYHPTFDIRDVKKSFLTTS